MLELTYQLPYPPSVNHIYQRTRKGGVMLNAKARDYREDVISMIGTNHTAFSGNVWVRVALYMPDKRKRDIDGPIKALLDAMTHSRVWGDDSQVRKLYIDHMGVESPGRVLVTVRAAG